MQAQRSRNERTRRFLLGLSVLTVIGLLLRFIVARQLLAGDPLVAHPPSTTDSATYQQMAIAYATGKAGWGDQGFYYQPFYYAVFLPVLWFIGGSSGFVAVVGVVQMLLGAATVWLTGLTAARLWGRRAGWIAAGLLALCRMHIFYTPYTLIAVVQSFWVAWLVYLGLVAWHRPVPWRWGLAGAVCGFAIITRGNMQLFIPLLVGLAIWRLRHRPRSATAAVVIILVATQLPQLPFSIANWRATQRWTGPSTAAGAVLGLGNTPEAPPGGRDPGAGAGPMEYTYTLSKWSENGPGTDGGESMGRHMLTWIKAEPMAYLELKWRMLLLFWYRGEIPNNAAIETMGVPVRSWAVHLPILLDFWLIGGLAITGLLLSARRWHRHPATAFAGGAVVLYCLSIVLFYILARFRLPVVPLLCVFGGIGAVELVGRLRSGRGRLAAGLAGGVGFLAVAGGFDIYRYGWEARVIRLVRPHGVVQMFPDEIMVLDNGPFTFGGWTPLATAGGVRLRKRLAIEPARLNGTLALHLKLFGEWPRTVEVRSGELSLVTQEVGAGIVELVVPIDRRLVAEEEGHAVIELQVTCPNGESPGVLLDLQRQYGRTIINGASAEGEAVLQLRCKLTQ